MVRVGGHPAQSAGHAAGSAERPLKARLIAWNPRAGITDLEPENPAEAKRWTPAEAARFITYTADDPMGLMFRIAVLRGCRRAELCGFRWSYADVDRGILTVKRTILQLGGKLHEESDAKSRAGDRLVFLDAETANPTMYTPWYGGGTAATSISCSSMPGLRCQDEPYWDRAAT